MLSLLGKPYPTILIQIIYRVDDFVICVEICEISQDSRVSLWLMIHPG